MANESDKTRSNPYQRIRLEGTRDALVVFLIGPKIVTETDVQEVGRELLLAADTAIRIDMPMSLNFRDVDIISSALVGKLVLLNKKIKSAGAILRFTDLSPNVLEVIRRLFPGDGPAGSLAVI